MTGTVLYINEILQRYMKYLVLKKIVIAFTVKDSVLISTWISVINMRICNMLLSFFCFSICTITSKNSVKTIYVPMLDNFDGTTEFF